MKNKVWEYSGYEYGERPRALSWQDERLEIDKILDRWRSPGMQGFRVRVHDEREFELVYDEIAEEWNIKLMSEAK